MLSRHEPLPAVVLDRGWNVLRLMIGPGPVRDAVRNWPVVVPALLERARREAVGGVLDRDTAALVDQLRALPEVAALPASGDYDAAPAGPVMDVQFRVEGADVSFFSVVSTIGTPIDVTAQELRVEVFFPSDHDTDAAWHRLHEATPGG